MTDPLLKDRLVALWHSAPFDVGAMETSEVAFLADGMGWSEWTTAAGGVEVTGFRWRATGATTIEILEIWCAFGLTSNRSAIEWDELEWRADPPFTLDIAFGVMDSATPRTAVAAKTAPPGTPTLRLSGALGGATDFALLRRDVVFSDCRARAIAPDLGGGIVHEASALPLDSADDSRLLP